MSERERVEELQQAADEFQAIRQLHEEDAAKLRELRDENRQLQEALSKSRAAREADAEAAERREQQQQSEQDQRQQQASGQQSESEQPHLHHGVEGLVEELREINRDLEVELEDSHAEIDNLSAVRL